MTGWYKAGTRWHAAHDGHDRSLCGRCPAPAGLDTVAHGKTCITCSDLATPRYSCATCHDEGLVYPGGSQYRVRDDDMPCPKCSREAYR